MVTIRYLTLAAEPYCRKATKLCGKFPQSARRLFGRTKYCELALGPVGLSRELWSSRRSVGLATPLLLLPLERAGRIIRLWLKAEIIVRNGPRWFDPAHDRDCCRITRLPQINSDVIARLARRRAQRLPAREFDHPPARKAAAMGPPHGDGEREHEIIVLAGSCIGGQVTGRGEFATKILQLADQGLGFGKLAQDLEPSLVQ